LPEINYIFLFTGLFITKSEI